TIDFIETLLHESVHRTYYYPDYYSFNENLADFIARHGTILYLNKQLEDKEKIEQLAEKYHRELVAQEKFQVFLLEQKLDLVKFYTSLNQTVQSERDFLTKRQEYFTNLSQKYKIFMDGLELGTRYEFAFQSGKINNAVILSYTVYQAKQKEFEPLFHSCSQNTKAMLMQLKKCLHKSIQTEQELWHLVQLCSC
ncbi:MAG: aminopeptidase, partial [Silvanigrellaceae bacterium]|nr:aminopeptidase [Silvanigrellaceae bacterium]